MERFYFSKYIFSITPKTTLFLPSYNGSTLRGGFGHAFRRIICAFKRKECTDCLLKHQCVYAYVFETPIPADAQIMRKYTTAPHPFILEPHISNRQTVHEGEDFSFGLTLIGRATDYLPYFIYAFEELGSIGIGGYQLKAGHFLPFWLHGNFTIKQNPRSCQLIEFTGCPTLRW